MLASFCLQIRIWKESSVVAPSCVNFTVALVLLSRKKDRGILWEEQLEVVYAFQKYPVFH